MRWAPLIVVVIAVIVIAVASSAPDPAANPPPLRGRIAKLEKRVSQLEQQMVSLRALVCLQLPTC